MEFVLKRWDMQYGCTDPGLIVAIYNRYSNYGLCNMVTMSKIRLSP